MRTFGLISALLILVLVTSVVGKTQVVVTNSVSVQDLFNYVVIILMENHPLNYSTFPTGIIGNPSAPFITSFAKNYSLATDYFALSDGSLPNYIALTSANVTSVNPDCMAPGPGCSTNSLNIVDRIESSGRTWKAYMEDYSGGCNGTGTPLYLAFHNPFVFYTDITSNSTRCGRIVSANLGHSGLPDNQLIADLNSTVTASNYMWLTPNGCDSSHDNLNSTCSPDLVANGDTYLSQLVPQILKSTIFRTQRAGLFIVFDEPTACGYNQCPVPAIWSGPIIKPKYTSNNYYTHYSLLTTLESVWNLQPMTLNDQSAPAMVEFFRQ